MQDVRTALATMAITHSTPTRTPGGGLARESAAAPAGLRTIRRPSPGHDRPAERDLIRACPPPGVAHPCPVRTQHCSKLPGLTTKKPKPKETLTNIGASIRANPAPAGPIESITVCDGRHGTGVWPEFRERPRPARTSALLTGRAPGYRRNAAGHLPVRTTLAAGSPPPAPVGPARARCRTCARKGPVSGRGGPGHWRPSGRLRRPGWV